jgi:D-amino-acid dehydrogenase
MESAVGKVVVVGGGLVGLACAWYLRQGGYEVTLLERQHIAAGASFGNCGMVTPSHASPLTRPGMVRKGLQSLLDPGAAFRIAPKADRELLAWLLRFALNCRQSHWRHALVAKLALLNSSRTLLDTLIREAGIDCDYQTTGTLTAYLSQRLLDHEIAAHEAMRPFGVSYTVLSRSQLQARFPGLRDRVIGGLDAPGDAILHPGRLCEGWAAACRRAGIEIVEGVTVQGFLRERDKVSGVATTQGEVKAHKVVLAMGVWSRALAADTGVDPPLVPGKGYSITMRRPPGLPDASILLKDVSVCYTPWGEEVRLGSTMEFTGFDDHLNRTRLEALSRGWQRFVDLPLPIESGRPWTGFRPMMADELPVIGRSPKLKNVFLAFGHGMLGLSMCTATGRLVAELVAGLAPHIDPAPYSPLRFA